MSEGNYKIIKAQLPLVWGAGGHNLLVLQNSAGNVLGEMDGLATGEDNKTKPIGFLPSDKLKAYEFPTAYFYNDDLSKVTLFEGSETDTLEKWQMGKLAVNKINEKNYGYPTLGVGPGFGDQNTWAKNSNSVASTLIKTMGLEEKKVKPHDGLTPGEGHLLLSEEEIKEIQQQVKPTLNNSSQGNSQSKSDGARLAANKGSTLLAVSVAPSINYTSHKRNSTAPYVLTQTLDNAQNIAKHTYLNGKPAYILSQTSQPTCIGDASGIGGGVRSGTIGKQIKPTQGASNIFVEGKPLIRQNDPCTMNNGNTQGKYIALVPATPQQSTAAATLLKALPIIPGGQTISQALGGIATLSDAHNALKQGNLLGSTMSAASLIPNPKISQGLGMLNTGMQAAQAFQQGNLLGGAMSAASLIPNEKVAKGLGILNTGLQIGQQLAQGATLDAGMSIASMIPGSEKIMPMINMGRQLMSDLKPNDALIKNFAPDSNSNNPAPPAPTASNPATTDKGSAQSIGGTIVKGQGGELASKSCPCNNNSSDGKPINVGAPVNALYGSKVLSGNEDIDYIGRGYLSFGLIRIYNSQNPDIGWFGQGWKSQGYEQRLQLDPQHDRIHLLDNSGRAIPFYYLAPGEYCYQPYENLTLYRVPLDSNTPPINLDSKPLVADAVQATRIAQDEPLRFVVFTGQYQPTSQIAELFNLSNNQQDTLADFAGTALYFDHTSECNTQGTKATLLASGLIDNRGHRLHLHYTHSQNSPISHLPQYITDDADDCYRLEFKLINDKPRLTDLYLVQDINKPTSLFHYQYNTDGDLTRVIKQGQTVREFSYTNHLMTWQRQPNGQQAHYRYDQTEHAKTAKVIQHWLDNGQTYQFDYHTDENGIHYSTVTEQQGTDLERTRHYQYNDDYYLTAFTDPLGQQTHYQYDELNRITQIITPIGSRTLMTYQGNLLDSIAVQTSISPLTGLPVYRETHYQYDKAGNLTGITDALGHQRQFSYNATHDVVTSTDALGNQTHFDYDAQGNLIRQTLANGSYYSFEYNELGQLIRQTDCSNNTTTYHYDEMGRVILVIDPMGKQTQYEYDQRRPSVENAVQNANGADQTQDNVTEQPASLQLTTAPSHVLYADGHKEHFIYDSHNRLIQYRDNAGLVTEYHYTKDGLPQSRTNPNTTTLDYAYDSLRRLTCLTNENGERWTFHYDKADNLISETRFDGYTSTYQYDEMGQLIHQIDNTQFQPHQRYYERHTYLERDLIGQLLHKHCLDYELDEADKLTIYTNPFGQAISQQDFASRSPDVLKQNKHSTHYQYDLAGRLIKAISPDATTTLDYDAVGNLIEETLQRHHSDASFDTKLSEDNDHYGNDDDNEITSESLSTLTQTLHHSYDVLGNRISTTLPDGKVINQLYYGSGHLYNQSLCYSQDNQEQVIELRHSQRDSLHREISRQQGELLSEFSYDPMGRLVKQHSRYDERVVIERGYHYDSIGQLTHIAGHSQLSHRPADKSNKVLTQSFGRNHQYHYDSVGRLIEHKLSDYQHNTGIQERFAFDPASNRVPVLDNGLVTGLDTGLETTKAGHQNDSQHDSQHSQQLTITPTTPIHQAKDKKWHRTLSLTTQDSQIGYFYDRHGRIKHKTITPLSKTGEPLPQSVNGLVGYRESLQLFYNANNELCRSIKTRDAGVLVTTTTSRYFYDGFGRRIGKSCEVKESSKLNQRGQRLRFERLRQLAKPLKQTMLMLWDGNRQIQEYTKDHVFTTVFDQDSFVPVARLVWLQPELADKAVSQKDKIWLNDFNERMKGREQLFYKNPHEMPNFERRAYLRQFSEIKVFYYHTNHLGTPQELSDERGEVVWLSYDRAWGKSYQTMYEPQAVGHCAVSADDIQPFKFQGQMFDGESNLHYNRFRYYDYDVGMFIQRDPIGLNGGMNVFAYAPNPVQWIDPLGLATAVISGAIEAPLPPPAKALVLAGAGGFAVGTWGNNKMKANGISPGIMLYDWLHPEENTKAVPDKKQNKKKCLSATEPNIRAVLTPTPELTIQKSVSAPVIQAYVDRIEHGEINIPPVRAADNIIIDGNHRFIAAKLCEMNVPKTPWTISNSDKDRAYPIKNIKIDSFDWGNR